MAASVIDTRAVKVCVGDTRYEVDLIGQAALRIVFIRSAWRYQRVSQKQMNGRLGLSLVLKAEDEVRAQASA